MKLSINTNKLRQKAADIRQALSRLKPVTELTMEEFLADEQRVAASKYYLIVATEKETIPREKALEYELSLGAELEREIHYPVDIKVLNYAPVTLCHSVTRGKVLFSRDNEVRYEWVEKTWDVYLDMQYFLRNSLRDLLSPNNQPG
jgi:hypothetical protein